MKKIILTGGHLSPLLSVLEELRGKAEAIVIGRRHTFEADTAESLEYKVLRDLKVPFYDLQASRMQRKFSKHTVTSALRLPPSFLAARSILKKEQPDVVLTFGGYVGVPVSLAAKTLGIPVVLHEQTRGAGMANKLIGKIAAKICISYQTSEKYFEVQKTVLTGNPVRPEIFEVRKKFEIPERFPVLFVTGGSTGAHAINLIIEHSLEKLLEHFTIIHQTGDAQEFQDYERLARVRDQLDSKLQVRYIIRKFILPDEIGWVYKVADIVVGRAGANTVSELIALSKKALLIPLPHGQKNEQLENAKYYESTGLGSFILQKDATGELLLRETLELLEKKVENKAVNKNNAVEKIAKITLEI